MGEFVSRKIKNRKDIQPVVEEYRRGILQFVADTEAYEISEHEACHLVAGPSPKGGYFTFEGNNKRFHAEYISPYPIHMYSCRIILKMASAPGDRKSTDDYLIVEKYKKREANCEVKDSGCRTRMFCKLARGKMKPLGI